MPTCRQCQKTFNAEPYVLYCGTRCQTLYAAARRKKSPTQSKPTPTRDSRPQAQPAQPDKAMGEIDRLADELIRQGFLPPPYNVCPHDSRALWDYRSLSVLFHMSPIDLANVLQDNGPVFAEDIPIPTCIGLLG